MAKKSVSAPEAASPSAAKQAYTVLARRYRPQQFADLVGQEAVVRALVNALQSNRVAHAYLFTGARGVGKTSTARILAKALNCVQGPTPTPCDKCEICQSIASGEDVDVIEMDAASNRGIDEIREIRQTVRSRPSRSRYKIYIIDEVHMLTREAFNALLKTLEEPPEHVKFIFATTEVQKIPITILSRCQRFDFAGIGTSRIVDRLREVVSGEKMQADDEALELIARRAGGSMRDAQSLLDQLLAFGGERLTADEVHRLLGTAHDDRVIALASAVLDHDAGQALELLNQAADEGLQLGEFLEQLLDYWRDLMLVSCAGPTFQHLHLPGRHRETLAKQAAGLPLDTILAGLDVLSTTKARLRGSSHTRVLLEMALVRLSRLDNLVSLAQLAQTLSQPGGSVPSVNKTGGVASSGSPPSRPQQAPGVQPVAPPESLKKKPLSSPEANNDRAPTPLAAESLPQIWRETLGQIGQMLASDLGKAGLPAISGPNTLVLRFPNGYNAAREYCQKPANTERVETALRKLTGQAWNLRVEALTGNGAEAAPQAAEPTEEAQSRYRRQRAEALKEPLIKAAVEVLGAQLMDVEDGFGSTVPATSERVEATDGEEA
ncbi:MAG TPA: DNA polymerase III subunit gamma/tau [Gemmataceae bacterium]|nr:DNA polymerase III subunit gamma/tau [Gemmataceae bacterium]